ncbi:dermatopontin-like [Physella acuta]|uniref:dermatopontin-like n=1 Tax=Physella acuta TaxID=109671 RepID=UPI0027DD9270|nr:dermatopontin-like [Physella acuta]
MMFLFKLILLCAALAIVRTENFINDYDASFDFSCPSGEVLSYIYSEHNNYYEDRRFAFSCRKEIATSDCTFSGYVNSFDNPVNFVCPTGKVIVGIQSYNDNYYEDRRFNFQCCRVPNKKLCNCKMTNDANTWDGPMTLRVGDGQAIRGAQSHHDNYYEDRIWQFSLCELKYSC